MRFYLSNCVQKTGLDSMVCIEHELNSFWRCPDNAYPVKAFDAQDFDVFPPRNVHVSARLERNYLAMKS